ncbi:MAG: alcohol dehydrogenase catalytic domain-containing protein [Thermoflexales bacterium]|nr:alcohol dehydrogenase catalytic domain-containing protein [Thermoflexales bacterium]MCS7324140.1 alcohol dehydrogenase catalytic domain-containing protein [Thermoflexales bacterium]MDW8053981.1 alcohol dehydrogenase catalytic domain-containing protein [Anaerolineae bacterium]MDW8293103.1 alcohol dehydrogenase catalytic domain-containing protein [Anaerolineae bacterium]
MKALRLHAAHTLRLHEEPIPEPQAGEVLLRVTAVGICGSDIHWYEEGGIGDARLSHPLVLGHEFAAEIAEGPLRGTRVAVDPAISCGQCEWCQQGHPNLCPHTRFSGHGSQDGALREYMPWRTENLHAVPDTIDDISAAMLEPLGVAIHSVDLAHLRPGAHVGVIGCGPIGLLTLQVARLAGAVRLFATDCLPHRLEAAHALCAAEVHQADLEHREEARAILAATKGRGLDVVFECAGDQRAVDTAFDVVRIGGIVILCGVPSDDRTAFVASLARRKGLTIKLVRRMKHTYPRAIEMVSRRFVNVSDLVTHRFPLCEAERAFAVAQHREGIKAVVIP